MKKKIVVLYSTAGMGHKKAALAILHVLEEKKELVDVLFMDICDYANKFYRFLYLDFYVFMMKRANWLWGFLYYLSNMPWFDKISCRIRGKLDYESLKKLAEMLEREQPDAIVTSHFLLISMAENFLKKHRIKTKIFALVTDYGPHSYWLSSYVDTYFVGAESTGEELVKRGISASRIVVTGISTGKEFHTDFDKDELKEKYGLDKQRKTIFLMSGGFGVGPMDNILHLLNRCKADIQVIAVCGHNKATYERIDSIKGELNYPLMLVGFTDKVAEFMTISDLMVTKAGGISVTEALDANLPMVLFGSLPGQEICNQELLLEEGAAKKAKKKKDIPAIVDKILLSEDIYSSMKKNVGNLRKPYAAEDIVKIVLEEI